MSGLARTDGGGAMNEKQWASERRTSHFMMNRLGELGVARTKAGRRKLRLFACGCCRLTWDRIPGDRLKRAVEMAERFADGLVPKPMLQVAYTRVLYLDDDRHFRGGNRWREQTAASMAIAACHESASNAAFVMTAYKPSPVASGKRGDDEKVLCDLLRCVFGNPFRKPAFPKAWRTETVIALATGIYEGRAFDRLPILADALEEAGCDDPAMLTHLRDTGPHTRGCWVLDLALGR